MDLITLTPAQLTQFEQQGFIDLQSVVPSHLTASIKETLKSIKHLDDQENRSLNSVTIQNLFTNEFTSHVAAQLIGTTRDHLELASVEWISQAMESEEEWFRLSQPDSVAIIIEVEEIGGGVEVVTKSDTLEISSDSPELFEKILVQKHHTKDFELIHLESPSNSIIAIKPKLLFGVPLKPESVKPLVGIYKKY